MRKSGSLRPGRNCVGPRLVIVHANDDRIPFAYLQTQEDILRELLLTFLLAGALIVSFETSARAAGEGALPVLTAGEASHFAALALTCVRREYPNKMDHVMNTPADVESPRALHPAFYGCFDWHSSVHGHWMLVRLLRLFPDLKESGEVRAALEENLSAKNLKAEAAYFSRPLSQSFERTYGWAWALKLAEELHEWDDPDARRWYSNLQPLADAIIARLGVFLPKQTYPIRTGVHPNTAFALGFTLDYARTVGNRNLAVLLKQRSRDYYAKDAAYPAAWEPGGEDFLSPALEEADLMRRVLSAVAFSAWFHRFLPGVEGTGQSRLLEPAIVADRSDPKLVHLDGLNLSRAWCMRGIADALLPGDRARPVLLAAAARHVAAALPHVASGDYMGEHWLATFAVYLLSAPASSASLQSSIGIRP